jgi:hypothetical protein
MAALQCLKFDQRGLVGKMGNSSRSTSVTFAMAVVLKFGAGASRRKSVVSRTSSLIATDTAMRQSVIQVRPIARLKP